MKTNQTSRFQMLYLALIFCLLTPFAHSQSWTHNEVLTKSIQFYEAQQCGPLPDWNRFSWRRSCHTSDGSDVGVDLTGGWHDAGDHVKFHLPMAQAITVLAWTFLTYEDEIINSGNYQYYRDNLRFIADYIIKCHPPSNNNLFYAQVASGGLDHSFWEPPEENTYNRNVYFINDNANGTDLACGMAAAFASLSMVFDDEPGFSLELRNHAIDLFDFGSNTNFGYSFQINDGDFYSSESPYDDDVVWGALWLYRATNNQFYLNLAENRFPAISGAQGWYPSFRDHGFGSFLLLSEITGNQTYFNATENWLNNEISRSSQGGLYNRSGLLLAQASAALSFSAYYYAQVRGPSHPNFNTYVNYAESQFEYILGNNPLGRSYVVDVGNNFPRVTHHRAAHDSPNGDVFNPQLDNHILTGGLVGGPDGSDSYSNDRSDWPNTEVAVSGQSFFVGLAAQMLRENPSAPVVGAMVDDILTVNAPSTVEQGANETVTVNYSSDGIREIIIAFQLGSDPYTTYSSIVSSVGVGSGTIDVLVPIPSDVPIASGAYQFQVSLAEPGAAYADRFDNQAVENVSVIAQAPVTNNEITSVNGPEVISQGSMIMLDITYEATSPKDIIVSLEQNTDPFESFAGDIISVPGGVGSISVPLDVPSTIPAGTDAYQYQVILTPPGGAWVDRDDNFSIDNVDVLQGAPLSDALNNISAPAVVNQGEIVNVTFEYETTESRDIVVVFQQSSDPFTSYSSERVTVNGQGSATVSLEIPNVTPTGTDAYQFQSYLTEIGAFWNERFDDLAFTDVDVITTTATCQDGIQNGNETGVDCGGPDCVVCSACGLPATMTQQVENGDMFVSDPCFGLILSSQNGSCHRVSVNNNGSLEIVEVECPN